MDKAKITIEEDNLNFADPDLPIPPTGKCWRNKITGAIYDGAIYLGYIVMKEGKLLDNFIKEDAEDFELIDIQ